MGLPYRCDAEMTCLFTTNIETKLVKNTFKIVYKCNCIYLYKLSWELGETSSSYTPGFSNLGDSRSPVQDIMLTMIDLYMRNFDLRSQCMQEL